MCLCRQVLPQNEAKESIQAKKSNLLTNSAGCVSGVLHCWEKAGTLSKGRSCRETDGHPPSRYTWLCTGGEGFVRSQETVKIKYSYTKSVPLLVLWLLGRKSVTWLWSVSWCKVDSKDTVCPQMKWEKRALALILCVLVSFLLHVAQTNHSFRTLQQQRLLIYWTHEFMFSHGIGSTTGSNNSY